MNRCIISLMLVTSPATLSLVGMEKQKRGRRSLRITFWGRDARQVHLNGRIDMHIYVISILLASSLIPGSVLAMEKQKQKESHHNQNHIRFNFYWSV